MLQLLPSPPCRSRIQGNTSGMVPRLSTEYPKCLVTLKIPYRVKWVLGDAHRWG